MLNANPIWTLRDQKWHYLGDAQVYSWLLDPWNKVEFTIGKGLNETQSTNKALTHVSSFCKRRKVHGIAIAHPTKIQNDKNT